MPRSAEIALTNVSDIPPAIAQFAAGCGWIASGASAGNATVRRVPATGAGEPDEGGGSALPWKIQSGEFRTTSSGQGPNPEGTRFDTSADYVRIFNETATVAAGMALMISPNLGPADRYNPIIPKPTKLWCFGNEPDELAQWLGFVVEYGFNQYRHIYIGSLDRAGQYVGGDAISASMASRIPENRSDFTWNCRPLFRGSFSAGIWEPEHRDAAGSVVNLPNGLKRFSMEQGALPQSRLLADFCFGGLGDGVDDMLVNRGFADFSGEQLLFPINPLYTVQTGIDWRTRAIGTVRGVRNVNMKNLEPGQLVSVGNYNWRVFPISSKLTRMTDPLEGSEAPTRGWPRFETSGWWGHAYLVSEGA